MQRPRNPIPLALLGSSFVLHKTAIAQTHSPAGELQS